MKYRPSILAPVLLLMAAVCLPSQAWAVGAFVTGDYAGGLGVAAGTLPVIAGTTGATAVSTGELAIDMNGALGEAGAMTPGAAPTHGAIAAKNYHNAEAYQYRIDEVRGSLRKEATIVDLSPKTIMKFFSDLRAGRVGAQLSEALENKWESIKDELANSFSEEAINAALDNLITDILNCNTPQLGALFPTINLDLGLAICDYGKLFNNMKDQVGSLVDKGWGGQFNINGRPVSEVLKDPSSLKDAIKFTTPGYGHAIVADFLSDQSINASYQAKIDAASIAQQLGLTPKMREMKRLVKSESLIDATHENTDALVKVGSINNVYGAAGLQNQATQLQIEQIREQRAAQEANQRLIESSASRMLGNLGSY